MTSRQTELRAKAAAARAQAPEPTPEETPAPEETPEPTPEQGDQGDTVDAPPEERATQGDIAHALYQGLDVEVTDAQAIAWKIAQRIIAASTAEEVWEPLAPIDAAQLALTEKPIRVEAFEVLRSAFDSVAGVYLIIDAVDLGTGELLLVKCGATNVVAQLIRARELGALPENLKFQARQSALHPDRSILWLRKVPAEQLP